jgi:hypothetical protein
VNDDRHATLDRLNDLAQLQEHRFTSRVPLIGGLIAAFRTAWNNISARWYVAPVLRQQSEFNRVTVEQLAAVMAELDRQTEALTALHSQVTERFVAVEKDFGVLRGELIQLQEWLISRDRILMGSQSDSGELARLQEWLISQDRAPTGPRHDTGELARLQEWLISQDRAQTELRHDLGELALLVGQLARRQEAPDFDLNEPDTTHVADPLT